mgnify:CR=1 FL=1
MKFSSFYEFKKEQLPQHLYEEIRYIISTIGRVHSDFESNSKV